jgi:hypothetical protein
VAAPLPFSENELRLLGALLKHEVRFMIVGLSAAALQGAPVVTQDVDLWFERLGEESMSRALREVGAAYVPPSLDNPPMLAGAGAELFDIVIRPHSHQQNGREPAQGQADHCGLTGRVGRDTSRGAAQKQQMNTVESSRAWTFSGQFFRKGAAIYHVMKL